VVVDVVVVVGAGGPVVIACSQEVPVNPEGQEQEFLKVSQVPPLRQAQEPEGIVTVIKTSHSGPVNRGGQTQLRPLE
jgi:hypothetical protein